MVVGRDSSGARFLFAPELEATVGVLMSARAKFSRRSGLTTGPVAHCQPFGDLALCNIFICFFFFSFLLSPIISYVIFFLALSNFLLYRTPRADMR